MLEETIKELKKDLGNGELKQDIIIQMGRIKIAHIQNGERELKEYKYTSMLKNVKNVVTNGQNKKKLILMKTQDHKQCTKEEQTIQILLNIEKMC